MKKWLTNSMNTIVGIARAFDTTIRPYALSVVAQWKEQQGLNSNDSLNPFGRCDRDTLRWDSDNRNVRVYEHSAHSAEVSIPMSEKSVDNNAFGVNGSINRETSKENGMVSTCLFRDDNPEAWIEITFEHNDAEMRHFRY